MSRGDDVQVLDLSDPEAKRRLMAHVGSLKPGLYEVSIKPRRRTRTLDQNRYYWIAVVTPWLEWLRESEGDPSIDKDEAHEMLALAVLGPKRVTLPDGTQTLRRARTRRMKTDEFADYVERAARWLAKFPGIVVLPPGLFYEKKL